METTPPTPRYPRCDWLKDALTLEGKRSWDEAAELVGLSKPFLVNIVTGWRRPKGESLAKLREALPEVTAEKWLELVGG